MMGALLCSKSSLGSTTGTTEGDWSVGTGYGVHDHASRYSLIISFPSLACLPFEKLLASPLGHQATSGLPCLSNSHTHFPPSVFSLEEEVFVPSRYFCACT